MYEYANVVNGTVVNITTTSKQLPVIRYTTGCNGYVPIELVPDIVLARYPYWNERP